MAGSKKGERRGGAKKKLTDPAPKRTARQLSVQLPRKCSEDYARQVTMMVNAPPTTGQRAPTPPRDMMWKAQEYFHDLALDYLEQGRFLIAQMHLAPTREDLEKLHLEHDWVKEKANAMMTQALDAAFKAGPYYHSKMSPGSAALNESPQELMAIIIREIDDAARGRPTWASPNLKLVGSS
jgi:hypothetical protein